MEKGRLFLLKQFALGMLDAIVMMVFFGLLFGIIVYYNTPNVAQGINGVESKIAETTTIYDRTGTVVLYEIFGEENRKIISHSEIPDTIRNATIAAEDDSFYDHIGIDIKSIVRAFKANVESDSIEQGASTITQQLARSLYLGRERTIERKIKEAVLAMKLERNYSKDEILDMYLNQIPYGSNAYGIQAAAETFFAKDAKDLTLDEAAMLSSLPKATTYYSPHGNNKDRLINRQQYVLNRVEELELVSPEKVNKAREVDTYAKVLPLKHEIKAPHFVFYVLEQLETKYSREYLEEGGLNIVTSLDWDMQQKAEEIVRWGAAANLKRYAASNAALVAVDPNTGEILSMVGSKDYFNSDIDGQVNVATRVRQPGSSFKPIVYAKAFEKGFQPETLIYDVRTNFGPDGSGRNYVPNNYNGQFFGLVTMRKALAMSLNIPAVKALYLSGVEDVLDLAGRMGYTTLTDTKNYGLSLALGGGGINLLENTAAFSIFANDGKRNELTPVIKIVDKKGEEKFTHTVEEKEVLDSQVARKINSILSDNSSRAQTFGSNSPLFVPGKKVAAKTGTTQDYRDGWTMGYTPDLAVGVWAGNNDNSPMSYGAAGVFVAAPIWNKFMQEALTRYPDTAFLDYEKVNSDKPMISGKLEETYVYYYKDNGDKKKIGRGRGNHFDFEDLEDIEDLEKKEKSVRHNILYYVDRDEPMSSEIPEVKDPMFLNWEKGIIRDSEKDKKESDNDNDDDDEEYDD